MSDNVPEPPETPLWDGPERYTVISADCHGGAEIHEYRDYLPARLHDEFDAWVRDYRVPYPDLLGDLGRRNWDSDRRLRDLAADGIVAEVIYPNTVPPFFPKPSLTDQPPAADAGDLALRWEGLKAHNRWMVDFCAAAPGRRAGIAQVLLHDLDAAVAEVEWSVRAGLTGGLLLPGTPPGSGLVPLWEYDHYAPLWRVCEESGVPVNHHTGSAAPPFGDTPTDKVVFLTEVSWWAHRAFTHLIVSGTMERHPALQFVFTEQGTAWIPEECRRLDHYWRRMGRAVGSQEYEWGHDLVGSMSLTPSEYWARQCHVGASFQRRAEAEIRHQVGVDRIMWGCDYPHKEASTPFSHEALRLTYSGIDPHEVAAMIGGNAARLYGFDTEALAPLAAEVGPRVARVHRPLAPEDIPDGADKCPAFVGVAGVRP
ncbi:amidohydrolase [Yinghuangia sp. ASG 101]|uniref:amidohydrolase family protein n=1 Tax=Yinghuangia sp. ASG 101 TaxID=2896848 RepID=UPI001E4C0EDB|nr:amidohydrolase family protein [Yinghuangia sp. ASG 101]UGQ10191.1 amidohydrolase [Yinghuangia sp. ASG 101]